jgi:hypothetical protein
MLGLGPGISRSDSSPAGTTGTIRPVRARGAVSSFDSKALDRRPRTICNHSEQVRQYTLCNLR